MGVSLMFIIAVLAVLCGSFVYLRWVRKWATREATTVVKRSTKSKVFIIILNSLLLAAFIMTAWCYKDVSNGGDPLELMFLYILTFPALIVLGIILVVCKKRLHTPLFNGLIPFIGIVAFYSTLFVNGIAPSSYNWTREGLVGVGVGAALSIMTVVTTVVILAPKRNRAQTSQSK